MGFTRAESARAFDFSSLQSIISKENTTSVEALLPLLPPSLLEHYALMFSSRSLQEASPENPRVILYGTDARFLVTFNGAASQKGFRTLETMEFDPKLGSYTLREITFPAPGTHEAVQYSAENPAKCILCHGKPAHAIWDSPPLWPGAYGERYLKPLSAAEQAGIHGFLDHLAQNPRYSKLRNTGLFLRPETFQPSHENRYNGRQPEAPNEELSRFLSMNNLQRVAKTVGNHPRFASQMYALLGSLSRDCGEPEAVFAEVEVAEFHKRSAKISQWQETLKERRSTSLAADPGSLSVDQDTSLENFRLISELGLGVPTAGWTTALEPESIDFSAPFPAATELARRLLPFAIQIDPEVRSLVAFRELGAMEKYCARLRSKSVAARAKESAVPARATAGVAEALHAFNKAPHSVQVCASCHDGEAGSFIPFGNPSSLSAALRKGLFPHGSLFDEILYRISSEAGNAIMPRGKIFSEEERAELTQYLRSLLRADEPN